MSYHKNYECNDFRESEVCEGCNYNNCRCDSDYEARYDK